MQTENFVFVKKNQSETQANDLENKSIFFKNNDYDTEEKKWDINHQKITTKNYLKADDTDQEENIICSPELTQYINNENDHFYNEKKLNFNSKLICTDNKEKNYETQGIDSDLTLYELITHKHEVLSNDEKETDSSFSKSSCANESNFIDFETKSSIEGLHLRNPRGKFNFLVFFSLTLKCEQTFKLNSQTWYTTNFSQNSKSSNLCF